MASQKNQATINAEMAHINQHLVFHAEQREAFSGFQARASKNVGKETNFLEREEFTVSTKSVVSQFS